MQTISLKLPDDILEALSTEAKTRRMTKSSVVRESLRRTLFEIPPSGSESCYDLAADLAGSVKGLPEDIACNPRYMDGFGL